MAGSPPAAASRGASELALRWLSAVVLGPIVIALCWIGGLGLALATSGASGRGAFELYRMARAKGLDSQRWLGVAAATSLPMLLYLGGPALATLGLTVSILAVLVVYVFRNQVEQAIVGAAVTIFGIVYTGWLLSHLVAIRGIAEDAGLVGAGLPLESGIFYVLMAVIAIVGSDVGAFFVGRAIGRHKLAPSISPGKTLEGALGGIVTGALLAVGVKHAFEWLPGDLSRALSTPAAFGIGAVLALAGEIGDLVESLLKRDAQVKDAGHLIPGVGGVLDRIDSALVGLPVMYYLLLVLYGSEAP